MLDGPRGYSIFCDDLRQEVGGKKTLVGMYNAVMFVTDNFPVTIPKLVVLATYSEPAEKRANHVELNVYLPGESEEKPASLRATISFEEAERAGLVGKLTFGDEPRFVSVQSVIVLSPLVLQSEGSIKVRVRRGDEIIKLGQLLIRYASPEVVSQTSGATSS